MCVYVCGVVCGRVYSISAIDYPGSHYHYQPPALTLPAPNLPAKPPYLHPPSLASLSLRLYSWQSQLTQSHTIPQVINELH